ncbi:hypothetical protein Tco_0649690 [Tanacetum coccineum]
MQAPLRARFRDLATIDMKEILQQGMFKDDSYKANNVYNDLYEALQNHLLQQAHLVLQVLQEHRGLLSCRHLHILHLLVQVFDDQDSGDDYTLAAAASKKDWWKPLPEVEKPATPKPAWTILPSNVSDVENNWASALASSYEPPAENSLLAKTCDMTTFLNW